MCVHVCLESFLLATNWLTPNAHMLVCHRFAQFVLSRSTHMPSERHRKRLVSLTT